MTPEQSAALVIRRAGYEWYLSSAKWQGKRRLKLAEVGNKCEECGAEGVLDVHHKTYARLGAEELADLEVLCRPCHEKRHGREFTTGNPLDGVRL